MHTFFIYLYFEISYLIVLENYEYFVLHNSWYHQMNNHFCLGENMRFKILWPIRLANIKERSEFCKNIYKTVITQRKLIYNMCFFRLFLNLDVYFINLFFSQLYLILLSNCALNALKISLHKKNLFKKCIEFMRAFIYK